MREEVNIGEYLFRVDEVVNAIRGLGGKLKEKEVVRKILRPLPMRYDSKVSTLEEWDDLRKVTVDELHGIMTAYEMRTGLNETSKTEAAFKVSSKNQSENLDDEEALFVSKLKKGTWKYKGKLPLNVLTVEGLDILPISVPTQNKRRVTMKNLAVIRVRRSSKKKGRTYIPRKKVKMRKWVKMKKSYL